MGIASLAGMALAGRGRRRIDLREKVVVITGGSRGLGLLLARQAAAKGATLAICARNREELGRAREDLAARGATVFASVCDVADPQAASRFVSRVEERFGRIDVLINNASIIQVGPAETMSLEEFRASMEVNFWGTVHVSRAALPRMRARHAGRIVNITSIGGQVAVPHLLPYSVSKFAAVGFSSGLHEEEAKHGIVVTTIVPGLMRTGSFVHAQVKGKRAAEATAFTLAASLPLVTMSADRAAARIVRAVERGETFVTVGAPAKILRLGSSLFPSVTIRAMALIDRLALPSADGAGRKARPEEIRLHRTRLSRSFLTRLGDNAADRNNETRAPTR